MRISKHETFWRSLDLGRLRRRFKEHVDSRRDGMALSSPRPVIIGQSRCRAERARSRTRTRSPPPIRSVLLIGETGTGKELFATQIHERSARRGRPHGARELLRDPGDAHGERVVRPREGRLHRRASARQIGRFELADHSTIFLDEIGDLPPEVQVKLLRVLEERQIERLGSPKAVPVDVRIIAATHRDLERRIADGLFREDLFYRLNVFPIRVPPLRERVDDIPAAGLALRRASSAQAFGKQIDAIPRENLDALQRYAWPGNIRELRNVVERAMIVATGPRLSIPLPSAPRSLGRRRSERLVDVADGTHPGRARRARAGGFAAPAARRSASGSGRPRSRRAWPSWGSTPSRPRTSSLDLGPARLHVQGRILTAAVSWNCSRVSAGNCRCSSPAAGDHGASRRRRRPRRWPRLLRRRRCRRRSRPGPRRRRPFAPVFLPSPCPLLDVSGCDLVHHAAKPDRVELQADLVAAFHRARLLHLGRPAGRPTRRAG